MVKFGVVLSCAAVCACALLVAASDVEELAAVDVGALQLKEAKKAKNAVANARAATKALAIPYSEGYDNAHQACKMAVLDATGDEKCLQKCEKSAEWKSAKGKKGAKCGKAHYPHLKKGKCDSEYFPCKKNPNCGLSSCTKKGNEHLLCHDCGCKTAGNCVVTHLRESKDKNGKSLKPPKFTLPQKKDDCVATQAAVAAQKKAAAKGQKKCKCPSAKTLSAYLSNIKLSAPDWVFLSGDKKGKKKVGTCAGGRQCLNMKTGKDGKGPTVCQEMSKLYESGVKSMPMFNSLTNEVAKLMGAINIPSKMTKDQLSKAGHLVSAIGPLKSTDRASWKCCVKYGMKCSKVVDLVRGSVIFKDAATLIAGFKKFKDLATTESKKKKPAWTITGFKNRFACSKADKSETEGCKKQVTKFPFPEKVQCTPGEKMCVCGTSDRYRDILVNIMFTSTKHVTELQFHMETLLRAKNKEGHKLYNKIRVPREASSFDCRSLSKGEQASLSKAEADSRKLYDGAYAKCGLTTDQQKSIRLLNMNDFLKAHIKKGGELADSDGETEWMVEE